MKVMKFGGSSVADGQRMLHVADIVKMHAEDKVIVVVSALAGITDELIYIFHNNSEDTQTETLERMTKLYWRHIEVVREMNLERSQQDELEHSLLHLSMELNRYLVNCRIADSCDLDFTVSMGERFSARILAAALVSKGLPSKAVDSSEVIVTTPEFSNAKPVFKYTEVKAQKALVPFLENGIIPVVTGFFGATLEGKIATLGRGGSDYSATILASVLDAEEVILWKEVDGIFTGDPKKDATVKFYPELSYEDALSLAQKGAKVLHPEAMKPVAQKDIIVRVKNTFKPENPGTKIWKGTV